MGIANVLHCWTWDANAWTALAAWATFGVAMFAARYAKRQVEEARVLREEQSQPFVIVDFEITSSVLINLVVRNIGKTVARNINITFDRKPESTLDQEGDLVADVAFIKSGIPMLPPNAEVKTIFDSAPRRIEKGLPLTYNVTIDLEDFRGVKQTRQVCVVDLSHRMGATYTNELTLSDLAGEVKKVRETLRVGPLGESSWFGFRMRTSMLGTTGGSTR